MEPPNTFKEKISSNSNIVVEMEKGDPGKDLNDAFEKDLSNNFERPIRFSTSIANLLLEPSDSDSEDDFDVDFDADGFYRCYDERDPRGYGNFLQHFNPLNLPNPFFISNVEIAGYGLIFTAILFFGVVFFL
jgi:hypothetical protein